MSAPPIDPHANPAPTHASNAPGSSAPVVIAADALDALVQALVKHGYEVVGPVARDGNIVIDSIRHAADLPRGLEDVQAPGRYRLERRDHDAYFAFSVGSQSWKQVFHVPVERLFQVRRSKQGMDVIADDVPQRRIAMFGARSCDLAAIGIQDRVLAGGDHPDPRYAKRREDVFVVAVNCIRAGGTCFCASMKTGPRASSGYDLALTEFIDDGEHRFFVEIGSPRGQTLLDSIENGPASAEDVELAAAISAKTEASMGRRLDTHGLPERLKENLEHPRWDDVASRCLACANCTSVCPTCFCTDVVDTTSLDGSTAERTKHWDSCFNLSFTHVHGGPVRSTIKSRYRQWLTHKLSTWHDQFGSSGCVGCGRCISWCPVGIDITEEASAIKTNPMGTSPKEHD
ncbi:MAG: 4Fe-4S dicluster domain-containing protein [Polyangiaceae bacterium]|nr:4Fe-4S dicluster domain-containing protein [Polyangiaceae bacterium]